MKGQELSRRFYEEYGRPMLREQFGAYEDQIAAGIVGEGSDCFGYDDEISRDHDFEAGFCLWIPEWLEHELEFKLSRAYGKLPEEFLGVARAQASFGGTNRRGVMLIGEFYSRFTGRPGVPETLMEWLYTPEYSLGKKMAARTALMAQSGQYNLERCLKRGERGAAALALSEFVQNGLSLLFLLNRRYMPYYKWAFRAAGELPEYGGLAKRLSGLITEGVPETGDSCKGLLNDVEEICREVASALKKQGLTDGSWDYLEPHAFEIMERIRDGELRNLHVMAG